MAATVDEDLRPDGLHHCRGARAASTLRASGDRIWVPLTSIKEKTMRASRRGVLETCALLLASVLAVPAIGAEGVDPEADRILKSMSTYLGSTRAFTLNAEVALEVVLRNGQKLQRMSSETLIVQRPSGFRIQLKAGVPDAEFYFDGKTLTLYGRKPNAYIQRDVAGVIDDGIRAIEDETGVSAAGADLLFADPYAVLSEGVQSGRYLGKAYVDGLECHHLAFREDEFDWQLWVRTGDKPLPMRYVITSIWQTGAPQLEVSMRDWNTSPKITDKQFVFTAPAGATKLDAMPFEEIYEALSEQEGK
jgi:hypothetical protein